MISEHVMKCCLIGVVLAAAFAGAAPAPSQVGTVGPKIADDRKANIAVSGCLMRQGYATLIVADAQIDAIGDKAETAEASSGKRPEDSRVPPRWVLDNAGVVGQHVGERVQVRGISDWVTGQESPPVASQAPEGPAAPMPHIDVKAVKVLAKTCS